MASVNSVTASPSPKVQVLLFEVANQVALKHAQEYNWSTWHSWDVIDEAASKGQVGLRGTERYFWATTGRFGSCLGASTRIVTDLQAELGSNSDTKLRQYAKAVQLMTCAQRATAESQYHAVVGMCFDCFAIIIDHALHPAAFKVSLGSVFYMAPYIPLFRQKSQERFKYLLEDGKYKLMMDNKESTYEPLYFSEMDINKATDQIAIPAALEKQLVKGQEHILMPPRKYISVRSLLDREPQLIAAERVEGGWLATTVRIQVDFAFPMISMQIPMTDWLLKPQSKDWYSRLVHAPGCLRVTHTDATVLLEQELDAQVREQPYYELPGLVHMQALGEEFGLCYSVLNDLMWSVYRVWAPYRSKRADSVINGEASADEE